ncbi:MAG: DNA repair exonuclease [Rhodobacteraceae bacterium]|jgi:DNA repair exonuclease SbcCD nuclease subunit|nr:DNA repair exonuclease [Paracoccaceae bacterium]
MSRSFRFVHAADLHLGSQMAALALPEPAAARRFAEAPRAALAALVDAIGAHDAAFLVIAGDLYDGPWRDARTGLFFNREIARLGPGFPVFLLAGNHDAESRVPAAIPAPANLRRFPVARPASFRLEELGVALHGQGFAAREELRNLAAGYPPPMPGQFNIGVLHTALAGRPGHEPYAPCTAAELAARGYDYWALGHVHAFEVVAEKPHVVFPGVLQGRHPRETGAKGAVLVTVEDGQVAALERLVVDDVRWEAAAVDLAGAEDEAEVEARIARALPAVAAAAGGRPVALRLRLEGMTPLAPRLAARRGDVAATAQALAQQAHPDLWIESLEIAAAAPSAPTPADPALDLAALVAEAAADPVLAAEAAVLAAEVAARLPGGLGAGQEPLGAPLAAMIAEAAALARDRAGQGG